MTPHALWIVPVLAAIISAVPAGAAEHIDHASEYAACTALVKRDAQGALASAEVWRDSGGDLAARHCMALALVALGRHAEAAAILEALARDMEAAQHPLLADVLGQAGQAWLRAGATDQAYAALTMGIGIDPANAELLIDRAQALAAAGAYAQAIEDLTRALGLAPDRADIYAFRASAHRYLENLDGAAHDIGHAVKLAPDDPVALLERGNIRMLQGDAAAARADWVRILVEAPGTPAADAAQINLERLELKAE